MNFYTYFNVSCHVVKLKLHVFVSKFFSNARSLSNCTFCSYIVYFSYTVFNYCIVNCRTRQNQNYNLINVTCSHSIRIILCLPSVLNVKLCPKPLCSTTTKIRTIMCDVPFCRVIQTINFNCCVSVSILFRIRFLSN